MIDINLLRENPETIKKALQNRQKDISILEKAITLDKKYLEIIGELEALRAKQNQLSKSFKGTPTPDQISEGKVLKDQIKVVEEKLLKNNAEKFVYLEQIPNIPADDVPVGKDESDNVVIKTVGEKPVFDYFVTHEIFYGDKNLKIEFPNCKEEMEAIDRVVADIAKEADRGYRLTISETTQGRYEDISIGAGNLHEREKMDENGNSVTALFMGLWINYKPDSSLNTTKTVFEGDNFSVGKYNIFIKEIVSTSNAETKAKILSGASGVSSGYVTLYIEEE